MKLPILSNHPNWCMTGHFGSFTQTEFDKGNNWLKLKNYNQKQFPSNSQELRMALHKDERDRGETEEGA